MLRRTIMPAVLIELAFLSTQGDAELLFNDTFRNEACEAIAEELMKQVGQPLIEVEEPVVSDPKQNDIQKYETLSSDELEKARRILSYFI